MPVSYSFLPAWDARRKMDEGQHTLNPSPRPISPPKFPNSSFSLSRLSFPTVNNIRISHSQTPSSSASSTNVSVSASSSSGSSLQHTNSDVQQSIISQGFCNSYHRRFLSNLSFPSFSTHTTSTPSSRAPSLEVSSCFRPSVRAADRLLAWTTPFSQQQRISLESTLPPALVERAYQVVHSSLAPATCSTYGAGLLRFNQFCDSWKINEQDRMPASAALLSAFVSQCTGAYSGKTVGSWLSGIRSWHILNRAPWYGDDEWVRLARITANKQGTAFKRPLRAPVSLEHLRALRDVLDLTNSFHAAVWATATSTFFGCRRLGETTVKTSGGFDTCFHATRSVPVSRRILPNGSISISFRVPWTKTTKEEGATIILTSRDDDLCPVRSLINHLVVNKGAPPSTSFFAYQSPDGSWTHMLRGTSRLLNNLFI